MNQWKFGLVTLSCATALGVVLSGLSAVTVKAKSKAGKAAARAAAPRPNGKGRKRK